MNLRCFHTLVIVNNAGVNMGVEILISFPLDSYPEMGLVIHIVVLFLCYFFKYLHAVFHCGCINFHSQKQWIKVCFSPHPRQPLLSPVFYMVLSYYGESLHFPDDFSCTCWLTVCLLWKNVYLGPPSIILLDYFIFGYWVSFYFLVYNRYCFI